jgi:hypothetical protein
MFAWKYKDDRGKPVSLEMSSSVNWKRHREHKELLRNGLITPSREQTRAWRRAYVRYLALHVVLIFAGLAVFWLAWSLVSRGAADRNLLYEFVNNLSPGNTRMFAILILLIGWAIAVVVPLLIALWFWTPIFGEPWVRRRLLLRRCPSCDFSLVNLPVDQDMCTRCTECNAAWRIPAGAIAPDVPTAPT